MEKIAFNKTFTIQEKKEVEHQAMMGRLVKEGYAVGRYVGMWGKLVKSSGVTDFQLEKLIKKARTLKDYSPCGFVRNRLQTKNLDV